MAVAETDTQLRRIDEDVQEAVIQSKIAGEELKQAATHKFKRQGWKVGAWLGVAGATIGAVFGLGVGAVVGGGVGVATGALVGGKMAKTATKNVL